MAESIHPPLKTVWYFLLARNFILIITIIITFSLFYFLSDVLSDIKFLIIFILILLIFPLFIIVSSFISDIIKWQNSYYFFEKGKFSISKKPSDEPSKIISVEDIDSFELIQDDILARLFNLEIIGIRTRTQKEKEGLLHQSISEIPARKTAEIITSLLMGGNGSLKRPKNPGIRISKKMSLKFPPYYDVYLPLTKKQARSIKKFLDSNLKKEPRKEPGCF